MDTIGAFMFPGQWAGSFEPTAHSYVTGSHFYGGYRGGGLRNGWDEGWGEGEGEGEGMCDLEGNSYAGPQEKTILSWPY